MQSSGPSQFTGINLALNLGAFEEKALAHASGGCELTRYSAVLSLAYLNSK